MNHKTIALDGILTCLGKGDSEVEWESARCRQVGQTA